jgi:hypothetical protein
MKPNRFPSGDLLKKQKPQFHRELVPFKPDRYLYHLTRSNKGRRSEECRYYHRLGFVFEGIRGIDRGTRGVWANNQCTNAHYLWPMPIDGIGLNDQEYMTLLEGFDLWRIDTRLAGNRWYLDPVLREEINYYSGYDISNYLYTEYTVAPVALQLFTIKVINGTYSKCRDIDFRLEPVQEVNTLIRKKWHPVRKRQYINPKIAYE